MDDSSDLTPIAVAPLTTWSTQDLPLVKSEDFLPPISRWTTWGGLLMLLTLGMGIALAAMTKYRVTVASPATLRPVGELRLVQATAEGQIMQILVKENQVVKQGDVIATLENSKMVTKKKQLEIQIEQLKLGLEQFGVQMTAIDRQITTETERSQRQLAANAARLSLSKRNYQDKQVTTAATVQEAEANVRSAQNEWQKAQVQLKSLQADYQSAAVALKSAIARQARYQKVARAGAVSLDQYEETKLAVQQQQQKVEAQQGVIDAQHKTIAQLQQSIQAAQAKLQGLKANLNPTDAEVSIASANLKQEAAAGQSVLAMLNRDKESLVQKKLELNQQLEQAKRELQQASVNLAQTAIVSTADGVIAKLNLRNAGQVVHLGDEILQIVPSNNPLVIEATVSPAEISKIKTGQKVQMQVSACPYPDYGTLGGVVSQVSADAFKPPTPTGASPATLIPTTVPGYKVTIRPNSLALDRGQRHCAIQLGMEGKAEIIANEETFLQFMFRKSKLML